MELTLADFAPMTDALADNAAVIVGVIATVAGIKAIFSLVRRHSRI